MDVQTLWLVVLAIATPIAGVVGFAIQVSTVKQVRLENNKLQLEIEALKAERAERERLVKVATTEEVLMVRRADYDDIRLSRGGPNPGPDEEGSVVRKSPGAGPREVAAVSLVLLLALTFVVYLLYDLYRLGRWVFSLLGSVT